MKIKLLLSVLMVLASFSHSQTVSFAVNPLVCLVGSPVAIFDRDAGNNQVNIPDTLLWSPAPPIYAANYDYRASNLPAGLAVVGYRNYGGTASYGEIGGTPTLPDSTGKLVTLEVWSTSGGGSLLYTVSPTLRVKVYNPPTIIYKRHSIVATLGTAIADDSVGFSNLIMTVPLKKYSISPALPSGLVIDSNTGAIKGTATIAKPATQYTITAFTASLNGYTRNSSHLYSTTDTVNIAANPVVTSPIIKYNGNRGANLDTTRFVNPTTPPPTLSSTGGVVATFAMIPAFVSGSGFSFSTSTGIISGHPLPIDSTATNFTYNQIKYTRYIVSASNTAGTFRDTIYFVIPPTAFTVPILSVKRSVSNHSFMKSINVLGRELNVDVYPRIYSVKKLN